MIDGHAIVFRAYYAYPASLTTPEGEQINAVYGFASILLSVVRELAPTHIAVAFDLDKPTFRHIDYAGYKAQRPEVDVELTNQLDRVREVVEVLSMPIFQVEGFEADDVIGTLARQAADGGEVIIVTGDQDAMQLVDDSVRVWLPKRGKQEAKLYGVEEVKQKFELTPEQIVDLKALAGDASDNIPGVRGIGPKTATTLLNKFLTVERLYDAIRSKNLPAVSAAVIKKLADGYEEAVRSKKLAAIVTDVPIKLSWDKCRIHEYDKAKAVKLFNKFGFKSLVNKLPNDEKEEELTQVFEVGLFEK
ncbi:MAG: polymerase protein [Candidatus Beckwithbacteria bacterium GW2011_GWB1_47_15]|uniref:Polymerase protein n=1 Tax=Candidatus Beckwithbacteria bacterium GW2011_GWB1_47_15 TaxID=1618371 RepID=A0A0G1UU02_9BACT|nr:MAG: polymerase protein [Candidatus Beckwithbacteria bacterium GW2011_GWA1_46_30]KKU61185.1 MAG: polymerase protein [Candidatus Beckwithbacteria bacterium GW2011_GWB1_47_15]KKU72024.1 MAG: polymerase protein [Candidatus Beckwithbacteria bacterium GW2011_GWA2_47_25]KKW03262.1 MAG: polymerase protein [Candidatus Beckwithbacteria bacterium GW2011_GWC2_49_11]